VLIVLAAIYYFVVMKKEAKTSAEAPFTIHYAMGRGMPLAG
jgi:hypothetical protein